MLRLCVLLCVAAGLLVLAMESASHKLSRIQFAYHLPQTNDTIIFLPQSMHAHFICGEVLQPAFLTSSFCGAGDDTSNKVSLPLGGAMLSHWADEGVLKRQADSGFFRPLMLTIRWTGYTDNTFSTVAKMVGNAEAEGDRGSVPGPGPLVVEVDYLVSRINDYPQQLEKLRNLAGIGAGGNPLTPPDARVHIHAPSGYGALISNKTLHLDFQGNELVVAAGQDIEFDTHAVLFQTVPATFRTLDAPNIEPGSWFFSFVPRFNMEALAGTQQQGQGQGQGQGAKSRLSNYNVNVKQYTRDSSATVVYDDDEGGEPGGSRALIHGYASYGYMEFVLPPEDIAAQRLMVPPSERRIIRRVGQQQTQTQAVAEASSSPGQEGQRKDGKDEAPIQLCVWGSSRMDGQKQIWLQQAELLDKLKFRFTWVLADLPTGERRKATASGRVDRDESPHHDRSSSIRHTLRSDNAVESALLRLKHVHVVSTPYTDPVSFDELRQLPSDGSSSVSAYDLWVQDNDADHIYRYAIERLKAAKHNVELISPPWCRKMVQLMVVHLKEQKCDVVVYGNSRGYSSDVLITHAARMLNIPTVSELLNLFTHPEIVPDVIIAPSTYALRHPSIASLQINAFTKPRMLVVSPGVDLRRFDAATKVPRSRFDPSAVLRASQGSGEGSSPELRLKADTDVVVGTQQLRPPPLVVGFIGRLAPEKNPGLFLQSAFEIAQQLGDTGRRVDSVRFRVIGDGELRADLEQLAVMLGIQDIVEFTGWLSGDAYVSALRSIDLLVNPSLRAWSETFCIANIEAMAMAIPIVTFAVGGIGEYINEAGGPPPPVPNSPGKVLVTPPVSPRTLPPSPQPELFTVAQNAVLLHEATPQAVTAAVLYLHHDGDPDRLLAVGYAGHAEVAAHFTTELQMQQYEEIYGDVMRTRKRPASIRWW